MNERTRAAAILLQYGKPDLTLRALASLIALEGPLPDLYVVDNPSGEGAAAAIETFFKGRAATEPDRFVVLPPDGSAPAPKAADCRMRLIKAPRNLGFGGGINLGLRAALKDPDLDFFWILNNDIEAAPGALRALTQRMALDPGLGVLCSTLCHRDLRIQAVGGRYNPWLGTTRHVLQGVPYAKALEAQRDPLPIDYGVGAALLVRRAVLDLAGPLPEDYFLYFEDLDWAMRVRQKARGFRLDYCLESQILHEEGGTLGAHQRKGFKETTLRADYYAQRNRLRFARRWFPFHYPLIHLSQIGVVLNRLRRGQWRLAALALALFLGWVPRRLRPSDP